MRERIHVVRLGIHHQPSLLKPEVATADPARLARERVCAVRSDHPSGTHRAVLAGPGELPRLLLTHPAKRELHVVARVLQRFGDPPPLYGHPCRDAGMAMDRRL